MKIQKITDKPIAQREIDKVSRTWATEQVCRQRMLDHLAEALKKARKAGGIPMYWEVTQEDLALLLAAGVTIGDLGKGLSSWGAPWVWRKRSALVYNIPGEGKKQRRVYI